MSANTPVDRDDLRFATRRLLSDCVHCGLCLEACPTYRELGLEPDSPRGRLYLMKALAEGRLAPGADAVGHLDRCLGCRACEPACPSGVHYGAVLEASRAWLYDGEPPTAAPAGPSAPGAPAALPPRGAARAQGLRDRLLRNVLVGQLLSDAGRSRLAVGLLQWAARWRLLGVAGPLLPEGFDGARWSRAFAPGPRVDRSRWPDARRERTAGGREVLLLAGAAPRRGRVAVLTGCVMEGLFGRTNDATLRVLRREGWDVLLPAGQGCCGALAAHAGLSTRAAAFAAATSRDFSGLEAEALVVNAAGCGAHLKESGAARLPVFDVTEFLDRNAMRSPLGRPASDSLRRGGGSPSDAAAGTGPRSKDAPPLRVAYHDACHLAHAQRVTDPPRRLLAAIPGLTVVPLAESDLCCGSAGSYNILEPALAGRLGRRKVANLRAAGADLVTAANMGCLAQIAAHLDGDMVTIHLIELIDAAMSAATPRP